MSDLADRMLARCNGRRAAALEAPSNSILGAALQSIIGERADRGLVVITMPLRVWMMIVGCR